MSSLHELSVASPEKTTGSRPASIHAATSSPQSKVTLQHNSANSPRRNRNIISPQLSITSVLDSLHPSHELVSNLDAKLSNYQRDPNTSNFQLSHKKRWSWSSTPPNGSHSPMSSSGVLSPPASARDAIRLRQINSGFGRRKDVREGREIEIRRVYREKGVGRTGKGVLRVPIAMLRAFGVNVPDEVVRSSGSNEGLRAIRMGDPNQPTVPAKLVAASAEGTGSQETKRWKFRWWKRKR